VRDTGKRALLLIGCLVLVAGINSCGGSGGTSLSALQRIDNPQHASQPESLDDILAQLEALPVPPGADPEVFAELKQALRAYLEDSGRERWTSLAPSGPLNQVDDLTSAITDDGEEGIQWTYRNVGDYNLDSLVSVNDLTPIGQHFGAREGDADWEAISVFADGNNDGFVTVNDITPIGQNFGSQIVAWDVLGSDTEEGPFTLVDGVPWDSGEALEPSGLRLYRYAPPVDYEFYRVVPVDKDDSSGVESKTSVGFILADNVVVLNQPDGVQYVKRLDNFVYELEAPSADPVDIEIGDILLGSNNGGTLVRVESLIQNGTQVIVEGSRPLLSDAIVQGAISYSLGSAAAGKSSSAVGDLALELDGIQVYSQTENNLSIEILEGTFAFIPNIEILINFGQYTGLDYFRTMMTAPRMDVNFKSKISAEEFSGFFPALSQPQEEFELEAFQTTFNIAQSVNGLPIGAALGYSFYIGSFGQGSLDGNYISSIDASFLDVSLGAVYSNGQWQDLSQFTPVYGNVGTPVLSPAGTVMCTTYLRPEFSLSLY